jgi:hypothetical protein
VTRQTIALFAIHEDRPSGNRITSLSSQRGENFAVNESNITWLQGVG